MKVRLKGKITKSSVIDGRLVLDIHNIGDIIEVSPEEYESIKNQVTIVSVAENLIDNIVPAFMKNTVDRVYKKGRSK